MPVCNAGPQLSVSIESILEQSFLDYELLVVDDGSTDDTARYLHSLADPRLRVISVPHRGLAAALQLGLREAGGEYIARQDADDVAHPARLDIQVAFLDANPQVVLVGGWAIAHDGEGNYLGVIAHPTSQAALKWRLLFDNGVIHSSAVFRRQAALAVGGYSDDGAEDYDLWSRLARDHDVANIGTPLIAYQLAPTGVHATNRPAMDAHALSISTTNIETVLEGTPWVDRANNIARLDRASDQPTSADLIPAVEGLLLLRDQFLAGTAIFDPNARYMTSASDRDYVRRYAWRLIAVAALLAAAPTRLTLLGRLVWLSRRAGASTQPTMLLAALLILASAVGGRRTRTVRWLAARLLHSGSVRRDRLPMLSPSGSSTFALTLRSMGVAPGSSCGPPSRWRRRSARAGAAAASP
jgi:hypothetical protein